MKKPTQIAIKYIGAALLAFLIATVLASLVSDSGAAGAVGAGVTAGVFSASLFASTTVAYEQGKKDAVVEHAAQEPSS